MTSEDQVQDTPGGMKDMATEDSANLLEQMRAKAREIGRMPDMGSDGDATTSQSDLHVIRVKADTVPVKLAFHIVNTLKNPESGGVAICQAIGSKANQNVDFAVVEAQSIIVKYVPTAMIVVLPCIRKPMMANYEERTAIRKLIFAVNHKLVP